MKKKKSLPSRSHLENLEGRTLFAAVSLNAGILNVAGSPNQSNELAISADSTGRIWGVADSYSSSYTPSQVNSINLTEGSVSDQYTVSADLPVTLRIFNPSGALVQTVPSGSAAESSSSGSSQSSQPSADPSAPVATITTDSATSILPGQSVFVDALASTLHNGTVLTTKYQWDFGDPTSQYDQLVGFNVGHAYENPGNYTITLTITDSQGLTSVATQNVIVSPDTRSTIYVDSVNGSDSNNGSSPSSAIQSLAELSKIIQPNEIVLFDRGETFGATAGVSLDSNDTLDAYGTGASPVLQWQGGLANAGNNILNTYSVTTQNVVVQNLTFDTLNPDPDQNMPDAIDVGGAGITVRDNTFLNIGDCVNANGLPDGLLVVGNSQPLVAGMSSYFVWFQGENGVVIGNTSVNSTRQHNVRASGGFSQLLIEDNNLANLDRTSIDPEDYSKNTINMQWGSYIYVADNTLSDGPVRFGPLDANELQENPTDALSERETWVVVEDNTIDQTDIEVHPGTVNIMVRNNVVNNDGGQGVYVYGEDPTYNNLVQNAWFLDNTLTNTGVAGNGFYVSGQTSNVTIANNLYVAPNLEPGYYSTSAGIYVDYGDLSGFASISNNIWPNPAASQITWWGNGGVNYVAAGANVQTGFYTPAAWDQLAGVSNDVFSNVTLGSGYQATVNGVTAGANLAVAG